MYWRIISLPLYNVFGCSSKRDPECFFFFFFENGLYIVCLQAAGMIYIYIYIVQCIPPLDRQTTTTERDFYFQYHLKKRRKGAENVTKRKKKAVVQVFTRVGEYYSQSLSLIQWVVLGKTMMSAAKKKNVSLEEILTHSLSQAYEQMYVYMAPCT